MKKTLIAVAVAAALPAAAFAQTNVTLSGIMKLGVAQTKYSGGPAGTNGSGTSLDDGSSRFIISGSEDLGNGMRGIFMVDTRFRPDTGTGTLASGNSFVGLAGSFGTIRLGRLDQYYVHGIDSHGGRATPLQAASISLLSYVGGVGNSIANASRTPNLIRYDIPTFSGLSGGIGYSFSSVGPGADDGLVGSAADGRAWTVDLTWRGGPIAVGGAYWNAENDAGGGLSAKDLEQTAYRLFGSYNFGMFTVGLTWDNSEVEILGTKLERDAWSIPLTAKLGPGTLLFTYTEADDLDGVSNSGARMYSLGYDYPLSKRTSIGASVAEIKNDANANYAMFTSAPLGGHPTPAAGQDVRQFYIGLRHTF